MPEVAESPYTTGGYALFVKVCYRDTAHLRDLLICPIQTIPHVRRTETFISLPQTIGREPTLALTDAHSDEWEEEGA